MINKNIFYFLFIAVLAAGFASCENDFDGVDTSTITNTPLTLASVDPGATFGETERTVTVNFMFDENQIVDTDVRISIDPAATTATAGEDFIFSETIVSIPAYVREGSFTYTILSDFEAEGNETIGFIIEGVQDPFGATNELAYNATIRDSIYNTLVMTFDFDIDFTFDGSPFHTCQFMDMDFYLLDTDGNDLGDYQAATGACPETFVFDPSYEDGTYVFGSNLWDQGQLDSLDIGTDYITTVTATKGGVFTETFTAPGVWTTTDLDQANDGNAEFRGVATVVKSGNTYTVSLPDGTEIVSGLVAAPEEVRAQKQPKSSPSL